MNPTSKSFLLRHNVRNLSSRTITLIPRHYSAFSRAQNTTAHFNHINFDEETDVLIIGSGAGALTTCLRTNSLGLRSIVIEKEDTIGGASVLSAGGLWIPCNPVAKAAGITDTEQAAMDYFEQAVGDIGPVSSLEKRKAYLVNAPRMIAFLQAVGLEFHFSRGYPDYYPHMDGAIGKAGGRTIESKIFNFNKLSKDWQSKFPPSSIPVAIYTNDAPVLTRPMSSISAFIFTLSKLLPLLARKIAGHDSVTLGRALVAQLLYVNSIHGSDIRTNSRLSRLIQGPAGQVIGAELETAAGLTTIRATRGIVLAAGGFAHNLEMRKRFMPEPASTHWSSSPRGDTGDAIQEGIRLGAATALLDDAWWGPTIIDPITSKVTFALFERTRPYSIIVDSTGQRFMNEAQSYTDAGNDQYDRNRLVKAIPAWLIMDSKHRNRYVLGSLFPGMKPSTESLEEQRIFMASSLADLAKQIAVDPEGLCNTIERYNNMCQDGIDHDYRKGNSTHDQFLGDSDVHPNPNMGPLDKPPYYAIQVWPGDLGTKGGLLTDEFQRVLKKDLEPIPGLFAIGNTAASIMGRTYLGAGSTLGPAMTHGYIVANYLHDVSVIDAKTNAKIP